MTINKNEAITPLQPNPSRDWSRIETRRVGKNSHNLTIDHVHIGPEGLSDVGPQPQSQDGANVHKLNKVKVIGVLLKEEMV